MTLGVRIVNLTLLAGPAAGGGVWSVFDWGDVDEGGKTGRGFARFGHGGDDFGIECAVDPIHGSGSASGKQVPLPLRGFGMTSLIFGK